MSTLANPELLGVFLGAAFPLGLSRFLDAESPRIRRGAALIAALLCAFCVVVSGSPVGAVALCAGALAFAVIGIPSPIMWGTVMAVLSFLPVIGASLVWGPTAIILAVQGRWVAAIGLAIWGALAVGLVDNFLRPMLISGRTQMHPLLTFLAVLGGIQAFGMLGLFLGPVLVALVTGVLDVYRATVRGELGGATPPAPPSTPADHAGGDEEAEPVAG